MRVIPAWPSTCGNGDRLPAMADARSKSLAQRVRAARADLELTQKQLADVAGVSPSLVSKIESGRSRKPSMDSLRRLGRVLGLNAWSVDSLLNSSTPPGHQVQEFYAGFETEDHPLVVLSREVVDTRAAADRGFASQRRVGAMVVVAVQERIQGS